MKVEELSQADIEAIAFCCEVPEMQISRASVVMKRAYLPKIGHDGMMIKQDETVIAVDPGIGERVVVIEKFLSILANSQYFSLLRGKICHEVMEEGVVQTKFWSGFRLVQKPTENIFLRLSEIQRKVMLYPNDGEENFVVLDYSRPATPHYTPLVPCFPEVDDVVQVLGEEKEEWFGQVRSVSVRNQTAQLQPLTACARWPDRNRYVRDRRLRVSSENVHWNSILQVAKGRWLSGSCWEWLS